MSENVQISDKVVKYMTEALKTWKVELITGEKT